MRHPLLNISALSLVCFAFLYTLPQAHADISGYAHKSSITIVGDSTSTSIQSYAASAPPSGIGSSVAPATIQPATSNRPLTAEEKEAIQKEKESYDMCLDILKSLGTREEVADICADTGNTPAAEQPAAPTEAEIRHTINTQINQQFAALPIAPAQLHQDKAPNTLKNYNTNIYATADPQEFNQTILGRNVTIRAIPITYTFNYGDGTTLGPTTNPGYSVNDQWDIKTPTSHQYAQTGTFYYSVTTEFRGEYRVEDGNWQVIEGTATTSTEPQPIDVWKVRAGNVQDSCVENRSGWGCTG